MTSSPSTYCCVIKPAMEVFDLFDQFTPIQVLKNKKKQKTKQKKKYRNDFFDISFILVLYFTNH